MLDFLFSLTARTAGQVWLTLLNNWPFLVVSTLVAVWLKRSVKASQVSAFLNRHRRSGVVTATAAAVATPLCSCGTTAVVLGMMAGMMPWAPVVAFMVASPLTSPEELFYSAGLFGWPFALAFFIASILLGLGAGLITAILESRGLLANQSRFASPAQAAAAPACGREETASAPDPSVPLQAGACASCAPVSPAPARIPLSLVVEAGRTYEPASLALEAVSCCAAAPRPAPALDLNALAAKLQSAKFFPAARDVVVTGARLLVMFLVFAFLGYFLNGLIPPAWVSSLFGPGRIHSVPLAATLGLPFYINTEASLPLVRALMDNGMSQGAALAFMISGAGTSIGAVAGALTIARWRVVGLVIGILWVGAMLSGFGYDLLLALAR